MCSSLYNLLINEIVSLLLQDLKPHIMEKRDLAQLCQWGEWFAFTSFWWECAERTRSLQCRTIRVFLFLQGQQLEMCTKDLLPLKGNNEAPVSVSECASVNVRVWVWSITKHTMPHVGSPILSSLHVVIVLWCRIVFLLNSYEVEFLNTAAGFGKANLLLMS